MTEPPAIREIIARQPLLRCAFWCKESGPETLFAQRPALTINDLNRRS